MKKLWFTTLPFAALMCMSCVASVGPHGTSIAIAPPLPAYVELYEPYYVYRNYHYYHHDSRWYYSESRGGPWIDLPKNHYPREVRYKKSKPSEQKRYDYRYPRR